MTDSTASSSLLAGVCSCGGRRLCTTCVLGELNQLLHPLRVPAAIAELDPHSRRVDAA